MTLPRKPRLVEVILFASLIFLFAVLAFARPPLVFLTLLLAPIALAAVLYEFAGGALAALAVMIGVALLVALFLFSGLIHRVIRNSRIVEINNLDSKVRDAP